MFIDSTFLTLYPLLFFIFTLLLIMSHQKLFWINKYCITKIQYSSSLHLLNVSLTLIADVCTRTKNSISFENKTMGETLQEAKHWKAEYSHMFLSCCFTHNIVDQGCWTFYSLRSKLIEFQIVTMVYSCSYQFSEIQLIFLIQSSNYCLSIVIRMS